MLNLSDKELDRLSRAAAEQYEPEEDGLFWEKLEQQLDREIIDKPPATPVYKPSPIAIGSIILLLAGASYFLIKTLKYSNLSTQNQTTTVTSKEQEALKKPQVTAGSNPETKDGRTLSGKDNLNPSANAVSNQGAASLPDIVRNDPGTAPRPADNPGLTDKSNLSSPPVITKGKIGHQAQNGLIAPESASIAIEMVGSQSGHNKTKSKDGKNRNPSGQSQMGNIALVSDKSGKSLEKDKGLASGEDAADLLRYATPPELQLQNVLYPKVSDASLRKFKTNPSTAGNDAAQNQNKSLHINRALKVGIMFAPDYTNVRSAPKNGLSSNMGLTIGYEFADRWSVNTGLIYTKKNYGANAEDFHASVYGSGSWFHFDYVKGNCEMWEIPLSLRYDFSRFGKTSFFVNGGLSSYLMKREEYTFYYHNSWNTSLVNRGPYAYNNRDSYLLSIASVSVGMEYQFTKNFSLQAEPFIKIPLIGVGLGNLQLNSYGVSFSLRYAPVLRKTRH